MKTHYKDTTFFVNAGMIYPSCRRDTKIIDISLDWPLTRDKKLVTCKRCKKTLNLGEKP